MNESNTEIFTNSSLMAQRKQFEITDGNRGLVPAWQAQGAEFNLQYSSHPQIQMEVDKWDFAGMEV